MYMPIQGCDQATCRLRRIAGNVTLLHALSTSHPIPVIIRQILQYINNNLLDDF